MAAYAVLRIVLAGLGLLLLGTAISLLTAGHWLLSFAMFGLAAFSAVWFGGAGVALVSDAIRRGPSLVISAHGLEDRRQGVSLMWEDVTRAELRPSRVGIASLVIATRGGARRSPISFRVGAHRGRGDELVVPLQFLSPPPHISGLLMTARIERAGGTVAGKPFWA